MIGATKPAIEKLKELLNLLNKENLGFRIKLSGGCDPIHELILDEKKANDEVKYFYAPNCKEKIPVFIERGDSLNVIVDYSQSTNSFTFYYPNVREGQLSESIVIFAIDCYREYKNTLKKIFTQLSTSYLTEEAIKKLMEEENFLSLKASMLINDLKNLYNDLALIAENADEGCSQFGPKCKKLIVNFCDENNLKFKTLLEEWKNIDSVITTEMFHLYSITNKRREHIMNVPRPYYI